MPIRMATSTTGGNRPATNLNCMATIASSDFPQLGGGPGWVVPNHSGQVTMVVQNYSPVDMHIPRGTKMALLDNIHSETIYPMNGKRLLINLNERIPTQSKSNLYHLRSKKKILSKLNLNVPEDERKFYSFFHFIGRGAVGKIV